MNINYCQMPYEADFGDENKVTYSRFFLAFLSLSLHLFLWRSATRSFH